VERYHDDLTILAAELDTTLGVLGSLNASQWTRSTALAPTGEGQARWTVFELASHHDLFMFLTTVLLDGPPEPQAAREAASFYIYPRAEVAPVVYDLAYSRADGKRPAEVLAMLTETTGQALDRAKSGDPAMVGPAYFGPMRLDEFIATRVVETVTHGIDLTDALGEPCQAGPAALSRTADILDDLLARAAVPGRPQDLRDDDLAWIRAATGRSEHTDPRLPLIR
jgi:hypothetical protein